MRRSTHSAGHDNGPRWTYHKQAQRGRTLTPSEVSCLARRHGQVLLMAPKIDASDRAATTTHRPPEGAMGAHVSAA
jgi:hypothetical protein